MNTERPSLCVFGDHDHHFQEERISLLKNNPLINIIVIPNTNHGLEIKDDLDASLDGMKAVMKIIEKFMMIHKI